MADCAVYAGFPWHWVYPWTVGDLKKQLAGDLLAANVAATTCQNLDSVTLAQWSAFYAAAWDWSQEDTSVWGLGGQMDQGQSYQCALYAWQTRLNAANCAVVVRGNPNPAGAGDASGLIKGVGVVFLGLAGAYVVGQVAHITIEAMRLAPRKP